MGRACKVGGQVEVTRCFVEHYALGSETGENRSYTGLVILVGDIALSVAAISSRSWAIHERRLWGSGHARDVSVSGRQLGVVMAN